MKMDVIIEVIESFVTPISIRSSAEPLWRNTIINVVKIINPGLKLANHTTMIAVNPLPPKVFVLTTWFNPFVNIKPIKPQIKPDRTKVLIITFLTLTPAYLAVLNESPTNDNSKPCFVCLI